MHLSVTPVPIACPAHELTADDVRDLREAAAGDPHLEQLLLHGLTHCCNLIREDVNASSRPSSRSGFSPTKRATAHRDDPTHFNDATA